MRPWEDYLNWTDSKAPPCFRRLLGHNSHTLCLIVKVLSDSPTRTNLGAGDTRSVFQNRGTRREPIARFSQFHGFHRFDAFLLASCTKRSTEYNWVITDCIPLGSTLQEPPSFLTPRSFAVRPTTRWPLAIQSDGESRGSAILLVQLLSR